MRVYGLSIKEARLVLTKIQRLLRAAKLYIVWSFHQELHLAMTLIRRPLYCWAMEEYLVERQGFEPWELLHPLVFKTSALNRTRPSLHIWYTHQDSNPDCYRVKVVVCHWRMDVYWSPLSVTLRPNQVESLVTSLDVQRAWFGVTDENWTHISTFTE